MFQHKGVVPKSRTAKPISLTLIPPSPVTNKISLDIRGAVRNESEAPETFDVILGLDRTEADSELFRQRVLVPPHTSKGVAFRWATKDYAGQHKIILTATAASRTYRLEQPIEIISSDVRSTRTIDGSWVDIYHHDEKEGKPFNRDLAAMTDENWRELVRGMHDIGMNAIINTMLFQNFTHYGRHSMKTDGYPGKAYYPSRLFDARMPIAANDPLETILCEADKYGMHVFPGIGVYAFFDFTPGSLAWHKQVADEVFARYGHHPSFYGWYVSEEIPGDLGGNPQRWKNIVDFFGEFTAHCRKLAPDKPVMLASNPYALPKAVETYRKLLRHVDILCPFGFHRMPKGDIPGDEAARLLQSLCDEAGCHLWLDLETFVFGEDGGLYPRPIEAILSDLHGLPGFEKIFCYQYPGTMNAPSAARKPGGPTTVKLYQDYKRYLQQRR